MKKESAAVTPVIATIILIAGTLVLALVVGAYTFGLFGSNVKSITLSSATLYGGITTSDWSPGPTATSRLDVAFNNPGSSTFISSLTLTGTGLASSIVVWSSAAANQSSTTISFTKSNTNNSLKAGQVTSLTFFPGTCSASAASITTGQVFNYVINFANGQSVSGSLLAQ